MPSRRLVLWTLAAWGILAVLAAVRVRDWSYGADSGTFVSLILDTFGGMRDGIEGGTHFRFHWSPTLALLWPLLALTHSLWTLQAVLAAATVACAPLLAEIARPRLGRALADRCGYVVLVYPPLVAVGFGEFRDLGLFSALALGWWLALERRTWPWVAITAVLIAGLREDLCLELVLIGGFLGFAALRAGDRSRAAAGFGSALAGAASAAIYAFAVLPRVGPWPPSHFYDYPFAHGPAALLAAVVLHPLALLAAVATLGRLTYLAEALVPLALLPLRSRLVLLALPGLAIVLLANSGLVWRMGMHYAALWIPWFLIAFAGALATLRLPARWAGAAFALSALILVAFSPLHPLHYLRPSYHALGDARAALACVPADETVATHDEWYTVEAARRGARVNVLGERLPPAQWIVVAEDYPNQSFAGTVLPEVRAALKAGTYRIVCRRGAVLALARAHP